MYGSEERRDDDSTFDSVTLVNAIEGQIDEETLNIPVKSYAIQAEHIGESKVPSDVFQIYMKQNQ